MPEGYRKRLRLTPTQLRGRSPEPVQALPVMVPMLLVAIRVVVVRVHRVVGVVRRLRRAVVAPMVVAIPVVGYRTVATVVLPMATFPVLLELVINPDRAGRFSMEASRLTGTGNSSRTFQNNRITGRLWRILGPRQRLIRSVNLTKILGTLSGIPTNLSGMTCTEIRSALNSMPSDIAS